MSHTLLTIVALEFICHVSSNAQDSTWICGSAYRDSAAEHGIVTPRPLDLLLPEYADTTHFRIHYALSGKDAITISFLQHVKEGAVRAWRTQIDSLHWNTPIPDGALGGSTDLVDIYVVDTGSGRIDFKGAQTNEDDNSAGVRTTSAYIIMWKGIAPVETQKFTVAHEFNHVLQDSYNQHAEAWFREGTAQWMGSGTFYPTSRYEMDRFKGARSDPENKNPNKRLSD